MNDAPDRHGQPFRLKQRFFSLPTLISFSVAIAVIYFLATRFDLDWSRTWDNVRNMNAWLYVLGVALYYLSFVFRGLRWRMLARNAGIGDWPGGRLPSLFRASQLILMGWFVNGVTWLRLGDAYRAYAFSEDSGGGFSWSLGTVLAERAMDMATILILIVFAVALVLGHTRLRWCRIYPVGRHRDVNRAWRPAGDDEGVWLTAGRLSSRQTGGRVPSLSRGCDRRPQASAGTARGGPRRLAA